MGWRTLNFTEVDKKIVKDAYKTILFNLKDYLQHYDVKDELEYSKIFFGMLVWMEQLILIITMTI